MRQRPIPFNAEILLEAHERVPPPAWPDLPELWIFAYGSLMWDPGFPFRNARRARLHGYHRALCVWSDHYRGTPDCPGLVLGLDTGGSCVGRAYLIAKAERERVLDYLYRRELITGVYAPRRVALALDGPGKRRRAEGIAFVAAREHGHYAGQQNEARIARIVARASGKRGANRDYLASAVAHLDELGIPDGALHRLLELVEG